jgi:hypothetical protein
VYAVPAGEGDSLDYAQGSIVEVRVQGRGLTDGERRGFTLVLGRHDFTSDEQGTTLDVVPRDELVDPRPGELWVEWRWLGESGAPVFESAAQDGSLALELVSGEPDETGLIIPAGEGAVGGHLVGRWKPGEEVQMSFSAECLVSNVEEIK